MRRGVALPLVLVPVLAIVGLVTWGAVSDLDAQIAQLQADIPRVAADIEASERFGETAQELELQEKADDFAESLQPASSEVGREARGGASSWFLTLILTVFALAWGPRFSPRRPCARSPTTSDGTASAGSSGGGSPAARSTSAPRWCSPSPPASSPTARSGSSTCRPRPRSPSSSASGA